MTEPAKGASPPRLSRWRTFLLWALAVVWFSEMTLWGVRPLAEWWTRFWQQLPPNDPQLTSALYIIHALEATAKGALGVLAVFALRSRRPSVRTALFVPMALVPPLNLIFQFRAQGFPAGPTTVGTVLSAILWISFFLLKDGAETPPAVESRRHPTPSRWASIQPIWLGANGAFLALGALLFLFAPDSGVRSIFPCLSRSLDASAAVPPGLRHSLMAVGTHLSAVVIATGIATAYSRRLPTVRHAVTAAGIVLAGLMCLLPLLQIGMDFGWPCATSSLLVYAVALLASWLTYGAVAYRVSLLAVPPSPGAS